MELKKLDKKVRTLWLIESVIAVVLILLTTALVILLSNESVKSVLCIALGIPAVLLSVFIIVYPILRYAFYSYGNDETRITIKKGVIFKSKVIFFLYHVSHTNPSKPLTFHRHSKPVKHSPPESSESILEYISVSDPAHLAETHLKCTHPPTQTGTKY
jgi:hypothetical protein